MSFYMSLGTFECFWCCLNNNRMMAHLLEIREPSLNKKLRPKGTASQQLPTGGTVYSTNTYFQILRITDSTSWWLGTTATSLLLLVLLLIINICWSYKWCGWLPNRAAVNYNPWPTQLALIFTVLQTQLGTTKHYGTRGKTLCNQN